MADRDRMGVMPLPDDWEGTPSINDIYDLAEDDPTRCQATRGLAYRCHRPAGHDAAGYGHWDAVTQTIWWPEPPARTSSFHGG